MATAGGWVLKPPGAAAADSGTRLRLFCFPMAGQGAYMYHGWAEALAAEGVEVSAASRHTLGPLRPDRLVSLVFRRQAPHTWLPLLPQVCPVELPGHNSRSRERPLDSISALAEAAAAALLPLLEDKPFALFGHSMGAWVAFGLAQVRRLASNAGWDRPQDGVRSLHTASAHQELQAEPTSMQGVYHPTTSLLSQTLFSTRSACPGTPAPPALLPLLQELQGRGGPLPAKLYASGNRSPTLAGLQHDVDPVALSILPSDQFWQRFEARYGLDPLLVRGCVFVGVG